MATYTIRVPNVSSKASGTTLASGPFAFQRGSFAVTALAYDDAQGHPSGVAWGNRQLANRPPAATRNPGAFDIAMSVWLLPRVKRTTSHVTTATWAGAIGERVMAQGYVDGKNRVDQAAGANFTAATADPETALTAALSAADDFALAFFASEGPDGDAPGAMQVLDGGVWTAVEGTQRVGTAGPPPASNVTLQVGWLQLTSAQATQARILGATSRSWTCAIVTLKDALDNRLGLSPSDVTEVETIFEDHAPPLDPEDAAYVYSQTDDRYEVFDRGDMATRVCFYDGAAWVAG